MSYRHILLEKENRIARVTLNMPQVRNALNLEARGELLEAFRDLADDDAVRVAVLTGAGEAFCAGGDIGTMAGIPPVAWRVRLKKGQRLIKAMVELEKPIIAAINGPAAGAGVSIALACDFLIASTEATFLLSFTNLGIIPDWGEFYFLPLRIGVARAKELLFMGGSLDAREAERIGLINRAVPPDRLEDEVSSMASRLAQGPAQSYAMIKAAFNRWPANLEAFLEMESTMQAVAFSSEDFEEGRRAFLEKRSPRFRGK